VADDLERRIAKLEAIEDIRRLKARYAQVCDNGYDPDQMAALFTRDALFDSGPMFGVYQGRQAIHDFFDRARHSVIWAIHFVIAPSIVVNDDLETATGTWYLWELATMRTGDRDEAVWMAATYDDRYRKEDGVWRFDEVHIKWQTITPFSEGWVRRKFLE